MNDMNKCLEELFSIAERDLIFAQRLCTAIPKEKWDIVILNKYYDHPNSDVSDLAMMISLNAFKRRLSMVQLLSFHKSKNPLVLRKARAELLSVPVEYIGIETLMSFFKNDDWAFAHEIIGELLINNFRNHLEWLNLIRLQKLNNANTRIEARELFLKTDPKEFIFDIFIKLAMNENFNISLLAKETLLKHFPHLLKMEMLINFQTTESEYVRTKASKIVMNLPENKLNYTKLLSFSVNACPHIKYLSQLLMIKRFGIHLKGSDIFIMQSSKSEEVRIASRELALSLKSDHFNEKYLKRNLSSMYKETRMLASELLSKFYPSSGQMEDTTLFVLKHELNT